MFADIACNYLLLVWRHEIRYGKMIWNFSIKQGQDDAMLNLSEVWRSLFCEQPRIASVEFMVVYGCQ
jgi:hypothetical protein